MVSICAVIAVRNEAHYLRILLPLLSSQGIDVVIIDNDSTDDSQDVFADHSQNSIIAIERLPYPGYFSLVEQLEAKKQVYAKLKHDWVIHLDADEILEHHSPGFSLRNAIQEAHDEGYNALNFDEFVFLPEPELDYSAKNFYQEILRYYYFRSNANQRNIVWRREMPFDTMTGAGHRLYGDGLSVYPVNHIMRHYIALSSQHAKLKYLNRVFDPREVKRGWHRNRLHVTEDDLAIPHNSQFLFRLSTFDSKEFRKDLPASRHYWEWQK
jgi:glycosyltransferase involved in cell wall biosynthesis